VAVGLSPSAPFSGGGLLGTLVMMPQAIRNRTIVKAQANFVHPGNSLLNVFPLSNRSTFFTQENDNICCPSHMITSKGFDKTFTKNYGKNLSSGQAAYQSYIII
jgi:hypothetical protein